MKRLSINEIEREIRETKMFEPKPITIENDYRNSPGRWNGPSMSIEQHSHKAALDIADRQARAKVHEDKQRAALAAAESAKGAPLDVVERLFALRVK